MYSVVHARLCVGICFSITIGDIDLALRCNLAFHRGQDMLDFHLWNETGQYYNAYTTTEEQFDAEAFFNDSQLNLCSYPDYKPDDVRYNEKGEEECVQGRPTTPGAIMTDTFYAQVHMTLCSY